MSRVFIVGAKRSAIGSFMGTLGSVHPAEFGGHTLKVMLETTKVPFEAIDEVIVGNILPAGLGQGLGRQVSLKAGIPVEVPAYSINMVCGSGMKTIFNAYTNIKVGLHNLVVAGGAESMSLAPYLVSAQSRQGFKMGDKTLTDHMIGDALTDNYYKHQLKHHQSYDQLRFYHPF